MKQEHEQYELSHELKQLVLNELEVREATLNNEGRWLGSPYFKGIRYLRGRAYLRLAGETIPLDQPTKDVQTSIRAVVILKKLADSKKLPIDAFWEVIGGVTHQKR